MPVTWHPKEGTPEAIEHWRKVREDFATGKRQYTIIQAQPLAYEMIPILQARIASLSKATRPGADGSPGCSGSTTTTTIRGEEHDR